VRPARVRWLAKGWVEKESCCSGLVEYERRGFVSDCIVAWQAWVLAGDNASEIVKAEVEGGGRGGTSCGV